MVDHNKTIMGSWQQQSRTEQEKMIEVSQIIATLLQTVFVWLFENVYIN